MNTKKENVGNLIVAISGPSGVGKGTIVKRMLLDDRLNMELSISMTTRASRNNEVNGKEYWFTNKEDFQKRVANNEFVEWVEYGGNFYGTLKKSITDLLDARKNVLFEIDYRGVENLKKIFGSQNIFSIFILPPSIDILKSRLLERQSENDDSINQRMHIAELELTHCEKYDFLVTNQDLEKCYNEILTAIDQRIHKIRK